MRRIYAALLFCVPAFGSWFWHEWIKEVFWERVLHVLNPENQFLLQYGPPLVFASVVIYLLINDRKRTRREMLAIGLMIIGALTFFGGVLLYYGENGKLPFAEAKEEGGKENVEDNGQAPTQHIANYTERFGDISKLNNASLRLLTSQFAAELRNYEIENPTPYIDNVHFPPNATQEEKDRLWMEHGKQINKDVTESNAAFSNAYRMDMNSVRDELTRRLQKNGILVPPSRKLVLPAFSGMRAGVSPISDAADYLETLSRKLPN